MRILFENEIQEAICKCKPKKIAVAYVGREWKSFIPDAHGLDSIIISPTIGSNPKAIASLAREIGWGKIKFLDELHAKTYIGSKSAIIGSANLTRNGLGGFGLIEMCVEINDVDSLKKVNVVFEDLSERAQMQYPTLESKMSRLKQLEKTWNAAVASKLFKKEHNSNNLFSEFELLGDDHFYVLWYQPIDCKYSGEVAAIESLIEDDIHFANGDSIEKNKWVLTWRITDSNVPHKTANLSWLFIHEVFENAVFYEGCEYPNCAIQRRDMEVPTPPFQLTKDVVLAFKAAVQEKEIAKYLIQDTKTIFSVDYSCKGVPPLLRKMKQYLIVKRI